MLRNEVQLAANAYLGKSFHESRSESHDRKGVMIQRFFGLGDAPQMSSMSAIGAYLGISREAVRQTIDDFGKFASSEYKITERIGGDLLDGKVLYALGGEEEISSSDALLTYRVSKYLMRDNNILEKKHFKRMYIVSREAIDIRAIQSACVKQISHNGAVRIDEVCEGYFDDGVTENNVSLVIAAIQLKGDDLIVVPTPTGTYAYFKATGRNRLISRLKKIFHHFDKVRVAKLRDALMRDMLRRDSMRTVLPPNEVILDVCDNVLNAKIYRGMVEVNYTPEPDTKSNQYEVSIIDFIHQDNACSDSAQRREREIERAVKKSDKDAYGFSMAINHSPLIVRVRRGVYQLTGDVRAA